MRHLIVLILCLLPTLVFAQSWEDHRTFAGENAKETLRIISSTDTSYFAPIIQSFIVRNPILKVEYLVTSTAELDRIIREDPSGFDVAISSAMDLQLKLANDGFARKLSISGLPDWAQWRSSVFAFTDEPAVIVVNKQAFANRQVPQTRQDLIQALRERPEEFRNRVGTYDVRKSGFGYLIATQDARASETYWRLTEVMGSLGAQLYCCSGDMIDDLISGKIAVGYNVLGSYAEARQKNAPELQIILPSDFPTTMMRTAIVLEQSQNPSAGEDFTRHLIALQTNQDRPDLPLPALDLSNQAVGRANIALEPDLMTYLDGMKRRNFLKEWQSAIIQDN